MTTTVAIVVSGGGLGTVLAVEDHLSHQGARHHPRVHD